MQAPWSQYKVRAQLQNGADRTFTLNGTAECDGPRAER